MLDTSRSMGTRVDGRSGVVSVSSRARELRLLKGEAVIETRALHLVPGDVNRIEL